MLLKVYRAGSYPAEYIFHRKQVFLWFEHLIYVFRRDSSTQDSKQKNIRGTSQVIQRELKRGHNKLFFFFIYIARSV